MIKVIFDGVFHTFDSGIRRCAASHNGWPFMKATFPSERIHNQWSIFSNSVIKGTFMCLQEILTWKKDKCRLEKMACGS